MIDWLDWKLVVFVYWPILLYIMLKVEMTALGERVNYVFSKELEENKSKSKENKMFWNNLLNQLKILIQLFIPLWNIVIFAVLIITFKKMDVEFLKKTREIELEKLRRDED